MPLHLLMVFTALAASGPSDRNKAGLSGVVPLSSPWTTSPFEPPEEKLGVYVVNEGQGLDTYCSFRSEGPLVIQLSIPAVVNDEEIGADGKLINPGKLIQAGVLGANVLIRFPVYDIDSGAYTEPYGYSPERDKVYFNGKFIKLLEGLSDTWTDDAFIVPIGEIKFASAKSPGAVNELRVEIDTANVGLGEYWCMAVDWVAAELDCAAPYILAHGIASDASTWDDSDAHGVLSTLQSQGVRFERFSVTSHGTAIGNGVQLLGLIRNYLEATKADKVHIIAHSKGGLDAQAMQALGPPFKVLSLSTISTPHLGSVAADLSIIQKTIADEKINAGNDPNGFAGQYIDTWTFGQGPQLPGLADLTTYRATAAIASGLRGNISPTFTFGADADLNLDNELQDQEISPMFEKGFLTAYYAGRRAWRVMRDFSSAVTLSTTTVGGRTVLVYITVQATSPQPNDIVVTVSSANPSYGSPLGNSPANHSTIKTGVLIQEILKKTVSMR